MAFFLIVNFKPNNFFYSAKSHQPDTHRSKHFIANKNPDLFKITFKIFQTYGKIILVDDPPNIDRRQTKKERHNTYAYSAEDLISHSTFKETTDNIKPDKEGKVLRYHHFEVPVYIDRHGWNVRIVGEEKKSGLARTGINISQVRK